MIEVTERFVQIDCWRSPQLSDRIQGVKPSSK